MISGSNAHVLLARCLNCTGAVRKSVLTLGEGSGNEYMWASIISLEDRFNEEEVYFSFELCDALFVCLFS